MENFVDVFIKDIGNWLFSIMGLGICIALVGILITLGFFSKSFWKK